MLRNIGGSFSEETLDTEVGILESPSVLMPVYEFMKSKKIILMKPIHHFQIGKSNLIIELEKAHKYSILHTEIVIRI